MASGFLVLPDGRCFSRHWPTHDAVLKSIADALDEKDPLRKWLLEQLPTSEDDEELGNAWYRTRDEKVISRHIDMRGLTAENQVLLCNAMRRAAEKAISPATSESPAPTSLVSSLEDLYRMVTSMERGDLPLELSDWTKVISHDGSKVGPGW